MDFEGQSVLDHLAKEDAWLILSDPVSIQQMIPGCKLIAKIDPETVDFEQLAAMAEDHSVDGNPLPKDDHETVKARTLNEGDTYGVYMEIGVAGLNLSVGAYIYIEERSFPSMRATGEGIIGDYSFEMETGVEVQSNDDGKTVVDWWLTPDISGSLFRWGSTLASPIFNRVVNRFFQRTESIFEENS